MRINVLQHTPNEGPGAIAQWAALHHHSLSLPISPSTAFNAYDGFFNFIRRPYESPG